MSLILVPLMDAIGKRIASQTYQQSQYYLRIAVPSFLGEAGLAQLILIISLKIKCGDIIKQDTQSTSQYPHGVQYAYILNYPMLTVAQLVKITVNLRQTYILVKMIFEIFHGCRLARRLRKPGLDQPAEYGIFYTVESNTIKDTIKQLIGSVKGNVGDIGQKLPGFGYFLFQYGTFLSK